MNMYEEESPEMFSKLSSIVSQHPRSYMTVLRSKSCTSLMKWIDECVPQLASYKLSTKCFWILHGLTSFPTCERCGSVFGQNINVPASGCYSKTCPACSRKVAAEHTRASVEEKAKADSSYYDKIIAKRRRTCNELHNDPTWNNSDKNKQTCMRKYGADNIRKTDEFKAQAKKAKLVRHGDQNFNNIAKMSQTCYDKHGVRWPMQNPETRAKAAAKYKYDGCTFDSSQELCFYIWLKDCGIEFTYCPNVSFEYMLDGKKHLYIPDFIVEGQVVELKGDHFFKKDGTMCNPYDHTQDALYEAKHQCMLANNVKIIKQSECRKYVKHVEEAYGKDFIKSCKNMAHES